MQSLPGWDNPLGTDGFEFVEYTALDTAALVLLDTGTDRRTVRPALDVAHLTI
jgi:4-hydroxyphenylpyruvate dioxygenase-like putative hemolysin